MDQLEGITLREERLWLVRKMGAYEDAAGNRENMLRMIALIVPAHDMRSFAQISALSQVSRVTPASP